MIGDLSQRRSEWALVASCALSLTQVVQVWETKALLLNMEAEEVMLKKERGAKEAEAARLRQEMREKKERGSVPCDAPTEEDLAKRSWLKAKIGMHVKAKFDDDRWYMGEVKGVDGPRIKIEFDDGEESVEDASDEGICLIENVLDMHARKREMEERRADKALEKELNEKITAAKEKVARLEKRARERKEEEAKAKLAMQYQPSQLGMLQPPQVRACESRCDVPVLTTTVFLRRY